MCLGLSSPHGCKDKFICLKDQQLPSQVLFLVQTTPNLIPLTVKIEPSLSLPSYTKHNLFKLPIYRASAGAPIPEKERQSRDIVASHFNGYHPYFSETLWTAFDENVYFECSLALAQVHRAPSIPYGLRISPNNGEYMV